MNKDGQLSWRPIQLIHPVLYVDLVRELTKKECWGKLKKRFALFTENKWNKKIGCFSLPRDGNNTKKDKGLQISDWIQHIELKSIELAIDYEFLFETDISDCYSSIYTHSIAWAIEDKIECKKNKHGGNLGNYVDKSIQAMQFGQTNGIPQGSVLMDFIAELLLGYIDMELSNKLHEEKIDDYQILRYRDDYRIFVNYSNCGEKILRILSEILTDFGLRLNFSKTRNSQDIVLDSVKKDKLDWLKYSTRSQNILQHALLIKQHSEKFCNTGSVMVALNKYYLRLTKINKIQKNSMAIIGIIVSIAVKNPRTYPVCLAILSFFLALLNDIERQVLIKKIENKFSKVANNAYMEIWLQRAIKSSKDILFNEPLCCLVQGEKKPIWNNEWINDKKLKRIMDEQKIFN